MTNRDPKTGRFVRKENSDLISSVLPLPYDDLTDALIHGISFQKIKYEDVYKTKTPTNYWNYILVGVFGLICGLIGYGLASF